jgi:hypothetical protein
MEKKYKAHLSVNGNAIEVNEFTEEFLARVTVGAVTTLKGVEYIRTIDVNQDRGDVVVKVNGEEIELTPFPNDVIANTLKGLVSTLKGIDKGNINKIDVKVTVE